MKVTIVKKKGISSHLEGDYIIAKMDCVTVAVGKRDLEVGDRLTKQEAQILSLTGGIELTVLAKD